MVVDLHSVKSELTLLGKLSHGISKHIRERCFTQ
jgi:hypothetical protein